MTYLKVMEDFLKLYDELELVEFDLKQKKKEIKELAKKCRNTKIFKEHIDKYDDYYNKCIEFGSTSRDEFDILSAQLEENSIFFAYDVSLKIPIVDALLDKEIENENIYG